MYCIRERQEDDEGEGNGGRPREELIEEGIMVLVKCEMPAGYPVVWPKEDEACNTALGLLALTLCTAVAYRKGRAVQS